MRRAAIIAGGTLGGTACLISTNEAASRFCLTAYNAAQVAADYRSLPDASEDEYGELLRATHERAARRLLSVCTAQGGVYVKFGQTVASLKGAVPREFTDALEVLQDQARPAPWPEVRRQLEEELGRPLETLWSSFEPQPFAAASIAQVHRAITADGHQVAVKVQYPGLAARVGADLATLSFLTWAVARLFPDFAYEAWPLPPDAL